MLVAGQLLLVLLSLVLVLIADGHGDLGAHGLEQ
jgi:hypothetical protein